MYQFIRIGILYFQLKIVMLFIQYSLYFCTTTHIIIPFTTHTNFIHTRSQTYQCSSIILFISTYPIVYGTLIKVYWCTSSHFPHLLLFVHLSINWVSSFVSMSPEALFLHKTSTPTTHRIYIRSWWLCMQPFHSDTMAVWLVCRSTHQICHVISTLWVGRRRPHRIWFNRLGELPRHHVLYILTLVVFGVSMVGCMVARDVHYVDGTLMHQLMGVN